MNILIAYGTRFGATAQSAKTLADELSATHGHQVETRSAERVRTEDLRRADLIVVGSSIVNGRWKNSCTRVLKMLSRNTKPLAVFVSAAVVLSESTPPEKLVKADFEGELDRQQYAVGHFIDPVCEKYGVKPFARTAFGGRLSILGNTIIDNQDESAVRMWAKELV